ncbi:MAG: DUF4832 domain-containing protein [Candidatus Dojkabacteria bacterium]|nr:DUF4832 domain-containing protein [Candidatus Dojkabacteria bacterium]
MIARKINNKINCSLYSFFSFPMFLFLLFAYIQLISIAYASVKSGGSSFVEVSYTESVEYLTNPGIGWQHMPNIGSQMLPETVESIPREQISWKILNPGENIYNWSILDGYIDAAKKRGNQVSFRIYTMRGESFGGHQVPDWVIKKGAKITNGAPDYSNCVYQEEFGKFINQVVNRYDGNSSIAFIDISGYGNFNEWSWQDGVTEFDKKWEEDYKLNRANRDSFSTLDGQTRRRLVDTFIGGSYIGHKCRDNNNKVLSVNYSYPGFKYTQLVMPYAGIRQSTQYVYVMRKDVGFRFDCLGSTTLDNIRTKLSNEVNNIWKNAPVIFEFCAYLNNNLYSQAQATLKFAHGSIVRDNIRSQFRDSKSILNLMLKAGYRYYLKRARYLNTFLNNKLILEMTWNNVGYAPYYKKMGQDFELRVLLFKQPNLTIAREYILNTDISKWMPADNLDNQNSTPDYKVFLDQNVGNLEKGVVYSIYVGIYDKISKKFINIASNGSKHNNLIFIGNISH